jgi:hypothetical protein
VVVPATIPFALAAAFFPAALAVVVWLLATPPRLRRGLVYLSGAATSTVGSGIVILALLHGVQGAPIRRAAIEGTVQILLGAAFLAFGLGLLLRRPRLVRHNPTTPDPKLRARGHIGIFLLGLAMWTPSFAYLAAIDLIVDSELTVPAQIFNLLMVDVIVLSTIEVPLLLYRLAPSAVTSLVSRLDAWVRRHAWQLGSVTAAFGGIFLVVRGWLELV